MTRPRFRRIRWILRNILPGLAITLVLLLVLGGVAEAVLRNSVPFRSVSFKETAIKGGGALRFEPGSTVRYTDMVSYWVDERVNSLGFLDREPPAHKPPGTCRIVIVGDSLVMAAQVPNASKVQARLEAYLSAARGGRPVQVSGLGTFGIGQVNALGYLETVIRPLTPDLVVMMAADNDFSNNSAVLSALRYGWHPEHQWRVGYRRDPVTGKLTQVGPDDNSGSYYLFFPPPPPEPAPRRVRAHRWAAERSYLYDRLFRLTTRSYPRLYDWMFPQVMTDAEVKVRRMEQIRALPGYQDVFAGWKYPDDLFEDHVFHTEPLPPVFAEAEWLTRHAFERFRDEGAAQGFRVLVAADTTLSLLSNDIQEQMRRSGDGDALTVDGALTRPVVVMGRTLMPRGAFIRLKRIAEGLDLPVIDLYEGLSSMGRLAEARIPYDGHWSTVGHDRIAKILSSHIAAHPELCDGMAAAPARSVP